MTATLDKWRERAAAAERNRAAMPQVTAIVDEWRKHAPGMRVTHAREAGRVIGSPGDRGVQAARDWLKEIAKEAR